jgi:hypothetical protein
MTVRYRLSTSFNWYAGPVLDLLVGNFEDAILAFYARRAEAGASPLQRAIAPRTAEARALRRASCERSVRADATGPAGSHPCDDRLRAGGDQRASELTVTN